MRDGNSQHECEQDCVHCVERGISRDVIPLGIECKLLLWSAEVLTCFSCKMFLLQLVCILTYYWLLIAIFLLAFLALYMYNGHFSMNFICFPKMSLYSGKGT